LVLEKLEPKLVWQIFENVFIATPRESKKEEKIREALKKWISERAESEGLDITIAEDEAGNLLVKKPATHGMESAPPILFQGHMDMVCETDRPAGFDFDNNPIPVRIQDNGEWVDADGTTLGADNGIGCSLGLALMFDKEVKHGPLELLITVDEETGLVGAFALDPVKMEIESKILANLDSESVGVITIGSAGGGDTTLTKKLKRSDASGFEFFKLTVKGLFGGHSGVDIHKHRGNANKMIGRIFASLASKMDIRLAEWNGGDKHNAIPREASAVFGVPSEHREDAEQVMKVVKGRIVDYFGKGSEPLEPDIEITWASVEPSKAFSTEETSKIIKTVNLIPHGPQEFSPQVKGLVETSNNLAVVRVEDDMVTIMMSTRSSVDAELAAFRAQMQDLADLAGWNAVLKPSYPGWNPDPDSPFLKFLHGLYEKILGEEVEVKAIHAGLECGIIGAKIPGIQMLSIGPGMKNAHTPDEKLNIADVGVIYRLLKDVVGNLNSM
jgi:dipeptidase D